MILGVFSVTRRIVRNVVQNVNSSISVTVNVRERPGPFTNDTVDVICSNSVCDVVFEKQNSDVTLVL